MEKKTFALIILLLLCGCGRQRDVACSRFDDKNSYTLKFHSINDDIRMAEAVEVFELPEQLMADRNYFNDLSKQFDESCHLEENRLIRRCGIVLDRTYSLSKTIEELEKQRYHCE